MQKRYRANKFLKGAGITAIAISCLFLFILLGSIITQALPAFTAYKIKVDFSQQSNIDKFKETKEAAQFLQQYTESNQSYLDFFSEMAVDEITTLAKLNKLDGELLLPISTKLNDFLSGVKENGFDQSGKIFINKIKVDNLLQKKFNYNFFLGKESRDAEIAGVATSVMGSIYTILICILFSFPIAICSAIYLEEFAPKNILTSLIEVNINNLAAVPSIVFGLLGLAVLINFFDLPRSTPIVAGITLAMMILPVMIISTRQAFSVIPTNIKHAALALGATKMQVILHHTLPLALPGIMTGVILSIARALGETAPLILIGMVAFIVDMPHSAFDPATVMPVQIFLWAENPEHAFQAKTAAAILILLCILVVINMIAVYIRKKYEHRW